MYKRQEQNCASSVLSSRKSALIKCEDGDPWQAANLSWCTLLCTKDKNLLAYMTYRLLAFSAAALTQANFLPAIWRHQLYTPSTASGHSRSHSARTRYTTPCSNSVPCKQFITSSSQSPHTASVQGASPPALTLCPKTVQYIITTITTFSKCASPPALTLCPKSS